ncbi:MAG: deoxyhypusine synthase family protein [Candidatus Nezhaarchaeota archaeon]|nr:deoxyhypusine synthase family protein [Candidatus Nezhaarchaeota archaeon]
MDRLLGCVEELRASRDVKELLRGMAGTAFNGRSLGEALEILEEMASTCELRILALAGAVVPAGLRGVVREAIRRGLFNVVVSTGANVTHDLLMAFGGGHYRLRRIGLEDETLRRSGFSRVYDVAVDVRGFQLLERWLREVLDSMEDGEYSTYSFLRRVGLKLNDEGCLLRQAAISGCDVVVPAFYDSIIGVQVWSLTQTRRLRVVESLDLDYMVGLQFDAKKRNAKTGILIVGGGTPKNFALQSALVADKPFDYAVQITVDPPHYGGLSGATLEEAVSWSKLSEEAKHCTVYCDFTIALPLLLSALTR